MLLQVASLRQLYWQQQNQAWQPDKPQAQMVDAAAWQRQTVDLQLQQAEGWDVNESGMSGRTVVYAEDTSQAFTRLLPLYVSQAPAAASSKPRRAKHQVRPACCWA
jgi:hypothetical protein